MPSGTEPPEEESRGVSRSRQIRAVPRSIGSRRSTSRVPSVESKVTSGYCPHVLPIRSLLHACFLPVPDGRGLAVPALYAHRPGLVRGLLAVALLGVLAAVLAGCIRDDRARPEPAPPGPPLSVDSSVEEESARETPSTGLDPVPAGRHEPERSRGIWILAEGSVRVWDDPSKIPEIIDRAESLGVTDLFVQVYRGGRAFYAGPDTVERAPAVGLSSIDALRTFLDAAHRRGLRVHAWVNVLSLSKRADARLIERLGREAILVDRYGRSVLDYPGFDVPEPDRRFYRMGTPGIYLDPAIPSVRDHLIATYRDLVSRYPELDGLHLDYIRHPGVLPFSPGSRFGVGLEFGYGQLSRALYRAQTGNADPIEGAAPGVVRHANDWDAWRREQVTRLVEDIAATCRSARPGLVVSAAVIPYADRAYLSLAQDWRGWLESGALDLAMPMVYTLDDRLLRYQLESFAGRKDADRIWPGLGIWLFGDDPSRAARQIEALRSLRFPGEVLFSDDAIAGAPGLLEALSGRPAAAAEQANPP